MASAVAPARPPSLTPFRMAGGGFILLPALVFAWLVGHPPIDVSIRVPVQHFYIVTAVSLLAFGLAVLLAIAAMQIAQYRVLFLCLGYMAMGGIFAAIRARRAMQQEHEAHMQTHQDREAQLAKYDRAYKVCLSGRGYAVN